MRICKRIIEELQINARGEKPGRQQHIHNEHAQKSHSRTRGVANFGNVTRTEGAKHKKKVNGTEGENAISVFCNTPWTRTTILQKSVLSRWNGAQLFCIILMHGHEKCHRAWVTEQCVLCVFDVMKIKRLVREGLKKLKL